MSCLYTATFSYGMKFFERVGTQASQTTRIGASQSFDRLSDLVSLSSKRKTWEMILNLFLDMTTRNIFIPSSLFHSSSVVLPDDLKTPARYRRPKNASSSTFVIYSLDPSTFFMPSLFDILRITSRMSLVKNDFNSLYVCTNWLYE